MKFIVIALLAFIGLTGTTNAQISANDRTVFKQLEDMFADGTLPEADDLTGWRTGRCYRSEAPSTPQNGLLAAWMRKGPDNGPIDDKKEFLQTFPIYWINAGPAAFDNLTTDSVRRLQTFINERKSFIVDAYASDRSIHGRFTNDATLEWAHRKSGDYIVTQTNKNGWLAQMCYYFRVVN